MLQNILGKKEQKPDPNKDAELAKLREKFNSIVKQDGSSQAQPMQAAAPQTVPNAPQYQMVDPERAEENERITNLIMQQIKELIEIDNNLNTKIKELENKVADNNKTLSQAKTMVEQFNSRLELIEKNMEKFMGLYEVVTNRFNPFVSEDEGEVTESKPTVVEDVIAKVPETEDQLISQEINEIMDGSGLQSRLDIQQKGLVQDELRKAIGMVGPQGMEQVKQELSQHLSQTIGQQVQQAMAKHIKVSNEEIKNTMKDLLMETIIHLRQASPQQAVQPQPKPAATQSWIDKEVHPDYHFLLPDGTHVKNVRGLIDAMKTMDDKTFRSHVNDQKNDFAEWIRVVMKKNTVADHVAKFKTRQGILKALESIK